MNLKRRRTAALAVFLSSLVAVPNGLARRRAVGDLYSPVATSDIYTVTRGGALTTPMPGVLVNDHFLTGSSRAVLISNPLHGTVSLASNGSFVYLHDGSSSASDSFTYRVSNARFDSNVATVAIRVMGSVSTPVAIADRFAVRRGGGLTIGAPGVLA